MQQAAGSDAAGTYPPRRRPARHGAPERLGESWTIRGRRRPRTLISVTDVLVSRQPSHEGSASRRRGLLTGPLLVETSGAEDVKRRKGGHRHRSIVVLEPP